MSARFNVGDKVVCVEAGGIREKKFPHIFYGSVLTIRHYNRDDSMVALVEDNDGESGWFAYRFVTPEQFIAQQNATPQPAT